jgi:hypothetical protein
MSSLTNVTSQPGKKASPTGRVDICAVYDKPGSCFKEAQQCRRSNYLYAVAFMAVCSPIRRTEVQILLPILNRDSSEVRATESSVGSNPAPTRKRIAQVVEHHIFNMEETWKYTAS